MNVFTISIWISNTLNVNLYNPHKQKHVGISGTLKGEEEARV